MKQTHEDEIVITAQNLESNELLRVVHEITQEARGQGEITAEQREAFTQKLSKHINKEQADAMMEQIIELRKKGDNIRLGTANVTHNVPKAQVEE